MIIERVAGRWNHGQHQSVMIAVPVRPREMYMTHTYPVDLSRACPGRLPRALPWGSDPASRGEHALRVALPELESAEDLRPIVPARARCTNRRGRPSIAMTISGATPEQVRRAAATSADADWLVGCSCERLPLASEVAWR